jgi:two-component system, NtrC family, nitrogen regulation sensor histidine kinase NtrY
VDKSAGTVSMNSQRNNGQIREQVKRKRERLIILIVVVLVLLLTILLTYLSGLEGEILKLQNLLVFGLININAILLLLLVFLVVRNVVKLFFERRRGILGSKLRSKLVASFVGLSLVPTLLLFWVAIGFITNTIENWFSFEVESSLEESLDVTQVYYKRAADNALHLARQISKIVTEDGLMSDKKLAELKKKIAEKQFEYNLALVEVFAAQGKEITRAADSAIPELKYIEPDSSLTQEADQGKELTRIQPVGAGDIIRGVVPIYAAGTSGYVNGAIVVSYFVPESLVSRVEKISSAFQEYKQLKLYKKPITLIYIIMLSVITLLIIFSATWFGFHLSKVLTGPIGALAEATSQIAQGNLDVQIVQTTDDEMGSLVKSFNKMTIDLKMSKEQIEAANIDLKEKNQELDQRRSYMEIVLNNVAAGVLSFDRTDTITTLNKSAEKMLSIHMHDAIGCTYQQVLADEPLKELRSLILEINRSGLSTTVKQVRLTFPDKMTHLLVRSTILRDESGDYLGMVLVAEDVTELQLAQRAYAWKEVARRIAHEVKNPLTPIKLSAQRLRKKFLAQIQTDNTVFDECTKTIINQVDELKSLVNEFSNFARMPATNPLPNDLHTIIEETVSLYKEAHKQILFEIIRDPDVPLLSIDREQMKRALINILDNAIHSMENVGNIKFITSYSRVLDMVTMEIDDTGCGIPPEIKHKLFEPYFSTKKSGTGLGLAIVNTIISDHNGYIRIRDNEPRGTRFIIELPAHIGENTGYADSDSL